MSMQDPIADMFTRIMNIKARNRTEVKDIPMSKEKVAILEVMQKCGYVDSFQTLTKEESEKSYPTITVHLRKVDGQFSIDRIKRVSKTSNRKTVKNTNIPRVMGGLGTAILHTSSGVLSCHEARSVGVGGEVICYIYS